MKAALRSLARRAVCALRSRTLVLAYHHVGDAGNTAPWVTTSGGRFAEQIAFLAENRMVLSMDQLLADLRQGRVPRGGRVVVTFDDAALDAYSIAFPVLRRHGLPATVFVPTGLVGLPGAFWWDRLYCLGRAATARGFDLTAFFVRWFPVSPTRERGLEPNPSLARRANGEEGPLWLKLRLLDAERREEALGQAAEWLGEDGGASAAGAMTWEQLAELDASGLITLGAHTVSHPALAFLGEDQLTAEVIGSRDALAGFRSFRKVFAYPYGDEAAIGAKARQAVREAGFEAAFTTDETALAGTEDLTALGRVCVDDMPLEEFRWMIDHHLGRARQSAQ
jgi:peptidoglycan/xylan/chitin deacetylase (PgdA/CDA1 family)